MTRALTREALAATDPQRMVDDVLAMPHQLEDALWRVESARIEPRELPGGLAVCGMGGSGIGADLARGAIGDRARRPIVTVRGYALPPWLLEDALILCASYSGDTEETLACYEAARAADAPRVVLTTGGRLAELAREDGVPVIGVPSGMQPRASFAYTTVAALECAALCGAAPSLRAEIEAAPGPLARLAEEWGPDGPEDGAAKALAGRLRGTLPVIFGAGLTAAAATRWKAQMNENAMRPAFAVELPEADHNEICAWDGGPLVAPRAAVILEDPALSERMRQRVALTAALVEPVATAVERVEALGDTAVERLLSVVLLGDLTSVYLAVLEGLDPTPVEPIERFKELLDAGAPARSAAGAPTEP